MNAIVWQYLEGGNVAHAFPTPTKRGYAYCGRTPHKDDDAGWQIIAKMLDKLPNCRRCDKILKK